VTEQTIAARASAEKSKLKKVMGPRDLVLFYIATVASMRVATLTTENGPSVLVLWVLGFILFYLPQAFTTVELTSRHPEEGGIYIWVQRTFGDFHAFITAWFYWATLVVYFPAALIFSASNAAFIVPQWSHLADSPWFLMVFSLVGVAICVVINVLGLDVAKRLHNATGYLNLGVPALMILGLGLLTWVNYGSTTEFTVSSVTPTFGGFSDVILLAAIAYAFAGLESASVLSEEVQDPKRNVPRALVTSGVMVLGVYILISWTIMVVLPADQVSGLTGLPDTARVAGTKLIGATAGGVLASLVALSLAAASFGTVSAWMAIGARMPFAAGLDGYLPASFGRLHPKYATPHLAVITLGGVTAGLIILGSMGGTAQEIYRIFISLEIITYFIPYLYMFAALLVVQRHHAAEDVQRTPFAPYGAYVAGATGFVVTAASLVFALIPSESVTDPTFFYITVFGTVGLLIVVAVGLYANGTSRRKGMEAP
jgi:amino acid transporter